MLIYIEAPILEAFITQKAGLLQVTGGCWCSPLWQGSPEFWGKHPSPPQAHWLSAGFIFPAACRGSHLANCSCMVPGA